MRDHKFVDNFSFTFPEFRSDPMVFVDAYSCSQLYLVNFLLISSPRTFLAYFPIDFKQSTIGILTRQHTETKGKFFNCCVTPWNALCLKRVIK